MFLWRKKGLENVKKKISKILNGKKRLFIFKNILNITNNFFQIFDYYI